MRNLKGKKIVTCNVHICRHIKYSQKYLGYNQQIFFDNNTLKSRAKIFFKKTDRV